MRYSIAQMDFIEEDNVVEAPKEIPFEDVIDEAKRITSGDRKTSYGTPERNFQRISALWKAWLIARYGTAEQSAAADKVLGEAAGLVSVNLDPKDVAVMNLLQKLAREAHQTKRDNFVDIIGYARCAAEVAGFGKPQTKEMF